MKRTLTVAIAAGLLMAGPAAAQTAPGAGAAEAGQQEGPQRPATGQGQQPGQAGQQTRSSTGANQQGQDRQFATRAAESGHAEVALGEMGEEKASHDRVREFAQRMVADHSKANDELSSIAKGKGITLPSEKAPAAAAALENQSGEAFDRAFMQRMVEDHRKAVELFEQQAEDGQDAELKAFAEKQLPILREHLRLAEQLHQQLEQ